MKTKAPKVQCATPEWQALPVGYEWGKKWSKGYEIHTPLGKVRARCFASPEWSVEPKRLRQMVRRWKRYCVERAIRRALERACPEIRAGRVAKELLCRAREDLVEPAIDEMWARMYGQILELPQEIHSILRDFIEAMEDAEDEELEKGESETE